MSNQAIEEFYTENRSFPPSEVFQRGALTADQTLYEEADADYEAFWARQARELLTWSQDFHTTLEWDLPYAKWFLGGELNITYNCLDRHIESGNGEKVAFHWEGEPGDTRSITYKELLDEVSKFANVLKDLGLQKSDRVAIYMPMILELPIAMLACARIGVAHSVIFGGFSPDAIIDRCEDADAKLIITADAGYRRGEPSPLKVNVDAALENGAATVKNVIVVNRCDTPVTMLQGRDHWWHELMLEASANCPAPPMDSEQLLYLLYTSGTTAKPKGIMHTTGGYLTQVAFTHKYVFDIHPESDVYWCAADIGWVTGHSYIVYGPLANGCTSVMYEGTPDTPRQDLRGSEDRSTWSKDRLWDIIERYGVTQLYTAPTAIRTFMKWGSEEVSKHDLTSLRVLGTVGEPINPEAWMWYHENIGNEQCAIVDTWWQTETGSIMISPLPGITDTKPGSACGPLPGIESVIIDENGNEVGKGEGGYLAIKSPWPSMLRTVYGDDQRYIDTYWSQNEGIYFAGDGAKYDDEGYVWLLGRVDDVMNISGHRISTAEVESALVSHEAVAEAAVIGRTDEISGEAIAAFVSLIGTDEGDENLISELRQHVSDKIGPIAKPKSIVITADLPKTRSGKIMRRLLKDISEERKLGDVTTLANADIVSELQSRAMDTDDE